MTAAYVIAETFGLEKGLARRPREAPVFVAVLTTLIVIGMAVALIPNMPVIKLLVLVQVVNGMLLPVTLFFVWRLSSSRELMGELPERADLQPRRGRDGRGHVDAVGAAARRHAHRQRLVPLPAMHAR